MRRPHRPSSYSSADPSSRDQVECETGSCELTCLLSRHDRPEDFHDVELNGQPNGATPAWLTFDGGGEEAFHHTFNVRHPETYDWTVSLNRMLAGREGRFTATDEEIHAYSMAGTYDLKVTVRDDDGGTSETTTLILVD